VTKNVDEAVVYCCFNIPCYWFGYFL